MASFLFLSGSNRNDSLNLKLARQAYDLTRAAGEQATLLNLNDYPLPIYDGDVEAEQGMPKEAAELKEILVSHDGFFISSPEYNGSIPGGLKNMIDWTSRTHQEGEAPMRAYANKVISIASASPSFMGGLRGLNVLATSMYNIGSIVLPNPFSMAGAHKSFDENGHISDENSLKRFEQRVNDWVNITKKLHP